MDAQLQCSPHHLFYRKYTGRDIIEVALPVIAEQKEIILEFDSLFFAPSHKPEILWVGFRRNELFSSFSQNIHNALSKYFVDGNRFYGKHPVPHITLARFRSLRNYRDMMIPDFKIPEEFRINSCELWETVTVGGRNDYRSVMTFSF